MVGVWEPSSWDWVSILEARKAGLDHTDLLSRSKAKADWVRMGLLLEETDLQVGMKHSASRRRCPRPMVVVWTRSGLTVFLEVSNRRYTADRDLHKRRASHEQDHLIKQRDWATRQKTYGAVPHSRSLGSGSSCFRWSGTS
jgi:hypothetical protein